MIKYRIKKIIYSSDTGEIHCEKPENMDDPLRNEKHAFYILVQNNNTTVKLDIDNLHKLPDGTLRELNKALFSGKEITIEEAEQEMNS